MYGMAICAGVGGIELGLRLAEPRYRTICYIERESYAAATLVARMEDKALDEAPIWDCLESFDGKPWRGKVDVITAGIPCQPWSHANPNRSKTEDERWIWGDAFRVVCEVQPRYVFLENVPGLTSGGLEVILGDLAKAGYDAEWISLSAKEVGASHIRKRIWILAHTKGSEYQQSSDTRTRGDGPTDQSEDVAEPIGERWRGGGDEHRDSGGDGLGPPVKTEGSSSDVANPDISGLLQRKFEIIPAKRREPSFTRLTKRGQVMADSHRGGQPEERSLHERECYPDGRGLQAPLTFPPYYEGDEERWEWVLKRYPHLEPAIRRMASRPPDWVDRIRCVGNSVVPLVAATAWKILRARAGV